MSELPSLVATTRLWRKLSANRELSGALASLRSNAEAIAAKTSELLPDFTDHSIRHMDALWGVADQIFTPVETEGFSVGEAFVLGATFYVHDLGMALAATKEGLNALRATAEYKAAYERAVLVFGKNKKAADSVGIQLAARDIHAKQAASMIDHSIPGLDRYLLEAKELGEIWGELIGQVAASHHWPLREVEAKLGSRERFPDAVGGQIDAGFVACALRLIDYAHINRSRAPSLDRILRTKISADSLKHWDAQQAITGPSRDGDQLIYASTRALTNVEGWWTFYELATGLDREISSVSDYLQGRACSTGRLSLSGVKGIKSPQTFAAFVQADGFEPVDIRFRPDSMERLVELLGGRTLYGNDSFAPIRELIQNSRDAILLRQADERAAGYTPHGGQIDVQLTVEGSTATLSVSDDGVGMTATVITKYLLGVASDYWHSADFFADHPGVRGAGFSPVGRFGIGFLSVFMIGHDVCVVSQSQGGPRLSLRLRGVGQRGSLVKSTPTLRNGTSVSISFKKQRLGEFEKLADIVRAKAPMLEMPIVVVNRGKETRVEPGWWQTVPRTELLTFINTRHAILAPPRPGRHQFAPWVQHRNVGTPKGWRGKPPELCTGEMRVFAEPDANVVLLCSKGFALATLAIHGFAGLVEVGDVQLNAARDELIGWDVQAFRQKVIAELRPKILDGINSFKEERNIPEKLGFVVSVAKQYGYELLVETELPWVCVLEPPGDAVLMSPLDFRKLVAKGREILIGYGGYISPWNVESSCREYFGEAGADALIVPVCSHGQADVPWFTGDQKPKNGPLTSSFGDYEKCPLLVTVLNLIAAAWKVDVAELVEAPWAFDSKKACARLVRS